MQHIIISVICFAFLGSTRYTDQATEINPEFHEWMLQHTKNYTDTEYRYRLGVYLENKDRIQKLNQQSKKIGGATFAINQFADLTPEEFRRYYLGSVPENGTNPKEALNLKVGNAPKVWNWADHDKVTPVKNQGGCGSCWAFSATENIESAWMIAKRIDVANFKPLSPQQIVDCDESDSGCNGGWPNRAFQYVISAGGQESVLSYPYTGRDGTCRFQRHQVEVTISSYKFATTSKNEEEMKEALYSVAPLSVCVDAEPWQFYHSGVMKQSQCGNSMDHCTQATGYDTTAAVPFWRVRNSWGEKWGESGYIFLEYGTNTCAIANHATTAVV